MEDPRIWPRLEGPQNIPSFNKIVKCTRHGKMCTMVCMQPKCEDRTLCSECVLDHTHSHLAKVIPLKEFNTQTSVVPSLVQREIIQLRSQVFSLQNQLLTAREARKKEFRSVANSIKEAFKYEMEIFEKDGIQYLEKYFNQHTTEMSQILYTIQTHLETLQPYLQDQGLAVQSSMINQLLNYQDNLMSKVIPELNNKIKIFSQQVVSTDVYLNNEQFINRLSRQFNKDLSIRLLFTKEDPIKDQQIKLAMQQNKSAIELNPKFNASKLIDGLEQGPVYRIPNNYKHVDIKNEDFFVREDTDFMKVYTNHIDVVTCLCILDNTRFASAGGDKVIKLWNIDSGYQLANIQGHLKDIWALARISSVLIASGSADQSIRLWSIDTLSCVKVFHGHSDVVKTLCYCPDKSILVSGCVDSRIKLWDISSLASECKYTLAIHSAMIRSLCYIESKGFIVSASADNLIKATKIDKATVVSVLSGHYGEVNTVIYLYDKEEDSFVASGGADKIIIIWNLDKAYQLKQYRNHYDAINCLAYSSKYECLLSGSTDKQIIVWDKHGKVKNRIKLHSGLVSSIVYLERRNLIISGSWDNHIYAHTLKMYDEEQFA